MLFSCVLSLFLSPCSPAALWLTYGAHQLFQVQLMCRFYETELLLLTPLIEYDDLFSLFSSNLCFATFTLPHSGLW